MPNFDVAAIIVAVISALFGLWQFARGRAVKQKNRDLQKRVDTMKKVEELKDDAEIQTDKSLADRLTRR